ncbi:MAG: hypothetical protein ABW036_13555, partial [Flavitalea sp.]
NGKFYDVVFDNRDFADYCRAEVRPGFDTTVRFESRKFVWFRAQIQVQDNARPPLRIMASYGSTEIWAPTTDTTFYTRVLPNRPTYFQFGVGANKGPVTHVEHDTVLLTGFNDTFYHTFRLTPDQFKPR